MKRLVISTMVAAALGVPVALADPGHGKGRGNSGPTPAGTETTQTETQATTHGSKPPLTGPGCRPAVSFVLRGTLVSAVSSASGGSLTMHVKRANRGPHSALAALVGTDVSVTVDQTTRIRRNGPAQLSDLKEGDLLRVLLRGCKATGFVPGMLASKIDAHPPHA